MQGTKAEILLLADDATFVIVHESKNFGRETVYYCYVCVRGSFCAETSTSNAGYHGAWNQVPASHARDDDMNNFI